MNPMNTAVYPGTSGASGQHPNGGAAAARGGGHGTAPRGRRDADGMAVASFVFGLAGLLVFNLLLGPSALVLAGLAIARGTRRPGRAALGAVLGVADLLALAGTAAANGGFAWSVTG